MPSILTIFSGCSPPIVRRKVESTTPPFFVILAKSSALSSSSAACSGSASRCSSAVLNASANSNERLSHVSRSLSGSSMKTIGLRIQSITVYVSEYSSGTNASIFGKQPPSSSCSASRFVRAESLSSGEPGRAALRSFPAAPSSSTSENSSSKVVSVFAAGRLSASSSACSSRAAASPASPSSTNVNSTAGLSAASCRFSIERCVVASKLRMESISSSNHSTRTGAVRFGANTSRMPPRTANSPRPSTFSTREYPARVRCAHTALISARAPTRSCVASVSTPCGGISRCCSDSIEVTTTRALRCAMAKSTSTRRCSTS